MNQKIEIPVEHVLTLNSIEDWANKCPRRLPTKRPGETFLFLDKNGSALERGYDFKKATELGTYPVHVYRLINITQQASINQNKQ